MALNFSHKPNDLDDADPDIENSNMAILGGMSADDEDEKEDDEEAEGKEKEEVKVKDEDQEGAVDELLELERLAEEARQDKPDLDDLGIVEEEI